jgi:hypothetical protein
VRAIAPNLHFMFHCPNGEEHDAITSGQMRALGVTPAVPDLERQDRCGLTIEMKSATSPPPMSKSTGVSTWSRAAGPSPCVAAPTKHAAPRWPISGCTTSKHRRYDPITPHQGARRLAEATVRPRLRLTSQPALRRRHRCAGPHARHGLCGPLWPQVQRHMGTNKLVLDNGDVWNVVVLSETRLAVMLGGRTWVADIMAVPYLKGRLRPLLKCPRAHEGNFQALYYCAGELACRTHGLRYATQLAARPHDRIRQARIKLLDKMGPQPDAVSPTRPLGRWRRPYSRLLTRLPGLTTIYRADMSGHA